MAKRKVFQISDALTEGLEETITAAHNYSGELRIDVIPIKRIEVDPENPRDLLINFADLHNGLLESDPNYERKSQELASLQTIANSIREQGIINPVVAYKHGEKYRLVAGERRTLASILAGKSEIQAKILDNKPSELKISLLQWIENVERTDLSLWERLRNLEKITSTYAAKKGITPNQITVTELSQLMGCTKPHAMNYKAVLMADKTLKQLIQENKIRNLEKAALISNIETLQVRQKAIEACLAGVALKKLKVIVTQSHSQLMPKKLLNSKLRRGRQAMSVNLGMTKNIQVAKVILNSICQHSVASHFAPSFANVDWADYQSINETFKQLLKKLEELHT